MSKEEFKNEKLYQTTMYLARKMLIEGIISEDEYRQIDTIWNCQEMCSQRIPKILDRRYQAA